MFRRDFPLFDNSDTVYLDSASTTQKPRQVIDTMRDFMMHDYANIHRGAYALSQSSEHVYEASKEMVRRFLGAKSPHEIIYTYNATYAFNLLARSLIKSAFLKKGDIILLSLLEHHANIVPWQIISEEYGLSIDWIDITPDGRIDMDDLKRKAKNAQLISLTAASNVTGAATDFIQVKSILDMLPVRPLLVVDGSQGLPHFSIDVEALQIDFCIATGHKIMTDTGIGILYGKKSLLQKMSPAFSGGGAINSVTKNGYESAGLPYRYEPGTAHIIGAASLLASFTYIESLGGYEAIQAHERELIDFALEKISLLPDNIFLIGPKDSEKRVGVFSFGFQNHHPHDIADALAEEGICVRSGHHCTEPLHEELGVMASLRMSLYIYNTKDDIEKFFSALLRHTV